MVTTTYASVDCRVVYNWCTSDFLFQFPHRILRHFRRRLDVETLGRAHVLVPQDALDRRVRHAQFFEVGGEAAAIRVPALPFKTVRLERRLDDAVRSELVQWATRPNCVQLPQPVINVVEVDKPVPVVQKEILEVPVIREITIPIDRRRWRCALNQTTPSSANSEFPTIEQMERSLIEAALDRCQGDRLKDAAMLGIGKSTIYRKLKDFETATARAA